MHISGILLKLYKYVCENNIHNKVFHFKMMVFIAGIHLYLFTQFTVGNLIVFTYYMYISKFHKTLLLLNM